MDDPAVAGPVLDRRDVHVLGQVGRDRRSSGRCRRPAAGIAKSSAVSRIEVGGAERPVVGEGGGRGQVGGVALGAPASAQAASVAISAGRERPVVLELRADARRRASTAASAGPRPRWRCRRRACGPARRSPARTARPGPCGGTPGSSSGGSRRRPWRRSAPARSWAARGSGSRRPRRAPRRRSRRPARRRRRRAARGSSGLAFRLLPGGELVVDPAVVADPALGVDHERLGRDLRAELARRAPRRGRGRPGTSGRSPWRARATSASDRSGSTQTPTSFERGRRELAGQPVERRAVGVGDRAFGRVEDEGRHPALGGRQLDHPAVRAMQCFDPRRGPSHAARGRGGRQDERGREAQEGEPPGPPARRDLSKHKACSWIRIVTSGEGSVSEG